MATNRSTLISEIKDGEAISRRPEKAGIGVTGNTWLRSVLKVEERERKENKRKDTKRNQIKWHQREGNHPEERGSRGDEGEPKEVNENQPQLKGSQPKEELGEEADGKEHALAPVRNNVKDHLT